MKRYLFFLICIFCFINCFSQKRYNVWCFGDRAGFDFNNNPPNSFNNSVMVQTEGCASICDNISGQLLFFSNGISVWNRNHQVMPNGTGLFGGESATQSTLIVPKPGNNNIYYVFTVPEENDPLPLSYSIVDMTLYGGLGAVTTKNVGLYIPITEKLTATLKSNGTDYWIIAKGYGTDVFVAYSLTPAGVDVNPVVSHSGYVTTDIDDNIGYLRVSHNGSKLCIAYWHTYISQLLDFDNSTGIVSNPIDLLFTPSLGGPYGVEFSPDDSKLYISQEIFYVIKQYDLLAGSATAIQNSAVEITHTPLPTIHGTAMMLGPDNNIYISDYNTLHLSVIDQPNLAGAACNYIPNAVQLIAGTSAQFGLPNNINYPFTGPCLPVQNISNYISICADQTYQLPWGTVVNISGIYSDTIRNQQGSCDSIINTVNLFVTAVNFLNTTAHICSGQTYQLPSGTTVSTEGIYIDTLRSQASCDSIINTIHVFVDHLSLQNTEAHICPSQTYMLPSGTIVNTAGIYVDTLRSQAYCDSIINTIHLFVDTISLLNTEAHICYNQTYSLPSGTIVNAEGIYLDTLKSQANCDSIINTIHLTINDISFSNHFDSIYTGQTYTLPSGLVVNAAGVYQSALINSLGCDSIITTTLTLLKTIAECITLKNAITPNGDGVNDLLILYRSVCFKRMELNVFNRYGQIVYQTNDYKNDWNGKYKNRALPDGTYYYFVRVYLDDEHQQIYKNNLTILR